MVVVVLMLDHPSQCERYQSSDFLHLLRQKGVIENPEQQILVSILASQLRDDILTLILTSAVSLMPYGPRRWWAPCNQEGCGGFSSQVPS